MFFLILIYIIIPCDDTAQNDGMHLIYNEDHSNIQRKYVDSEGRINFYINKEHFISLKKEENLCDSEMNKIVAVDINAFINIAVKKRQKKIEEDEKKGNTISIVPNDRVFDCIFIYKKKNNTWMKYPVQWVDEIIN